MEAIQNRLTYEGQDIMLTNSQMERLRDQGLVYYCEPCESWHVQGPYTWDDIEKALQGAN